MKKKIFIAMHYLEIGGAETSLIGLLHSFDYEQYDVDLFLYAHCGEMMQYIPSKVNLLPEMKAYKHIESPILQVIKEGGFLIAGARLWTKLKDKFRIKKHNQFDDAAIFQHIQDAVCPFLPSLHYLGEYDLAISFLAPHRIVLNKVRAKKKIAWIHTDYSKVNVDVAKEYPVWRAYDFIASISKEVGRSFLSVFPSLEGQIIEIENILSSEMIRQRASENVVTFPKDERRINFLSVGRFCYAKNYENVPYICKKIREKGFNVYWYIIGYGADEKLIRDGIEETEMQNFVQLLGKKENPYPYMKACDLYIQPSRYEGKSVTVREAQILGKPVIITNYPTARSQVNPGIDGMIVPLENDQCAAAIAHFLEDTHLQQDIKDYLRTHDYSNSTEIDRLYQLLD